MPDEYGCGMAKHRKHTNQTAQVIISLGQTDFGRCPIGSKRPAALWPVAGATALEHLLDGPAADVPGLRVRAVEDVRAHLEFGHDTDAVVGRDAASDRRDVVHLIGRTYQKDLAEAVGFVAIIASLIFVGIETRNSTKQAELNTQALEITA